MGTDITTKLQGFTAQTPDMLAGRPSMEQHANARGMDLSQMANKGQGQFMGKSAPTPGYIQSGKNQAAPGTPGTSLQGPPALPEQGNPLAQPAGQPGMKQNLAQILQMLQAKRQ